MSWDTTYLPMKNREYGSGIHSDCMEIIKWLRNHGTRGPDWDFAGAGRSLSIWFNNPELEMVYILRWE